MALINVNFDEIPDGITPVEPGIYDAEIMETPTLEPTAKGTGFNLSVRMRVVTDNSPMSGRTLRDLIFQNEIGHIRTKQMALSAGLSPGVDGFDTEEVLGKIVKIEVTHKTWVTDAGVERINLKIEYLRNGV